MLKIKIENINEIKRPISERFVEYEINELDNRLIFPIYISNKHVEAVELLKEDDYYLLVPCIFNQGQNEMIINYNKVEDFDDVLDFLNVFIEFNEDFILEIENKSFECFMIKFFDNINPHILNLIKTSIFDKNK